MIHFLYEHPITAAAGVIFAVALWKGGPPERFGALLMIVDWLVEAGIDQMSSTYVSATYPTVICDFVLSSGFLALAIVYGRLWLGAVMIIQGVSLAIRALTISSDAPGYNLYAAVLNALTILLLVVLLVGALTSWRKRWTSRPRRRRDAQLLAAY